MSRPSRRHRILALVIPIAFFAIKFRYLGSGDTVPAELLPISILEHGSLEFPERFEGRPPPYWFHDSGGGRIVSNYPILPGIVNVPVFAAARLMGVDIRAERLFLSHITSASCAALSVLFVYLALEAILPTANSALGFALIYALCTPVWSVAARGLWQHGPALMFLSAGLAALLRPGAGMSVLAGLCLSLAALARPTAALIALPLAVWAWREGGARRLAWMAAAAAPPALLHAMYAWKYWGSPFSPAQPVGAAGFAGNAARGFAGNVAQGLAGILVSPSRGLFVFSPIFLFALPAAVAAFRRANRDDPRAPLMRALVVGTVLTLAVYSRWRIWWGGYSFGYRLLSELALPLTVLLAWDWPRIRDSRLARPLFAVAFALSFFVHALGAYQYPTSFDTDAEADPIRLWDPFDTELTLRARRILGQFRDRSDERLAPRLRTPSPPDPSWWRGPARDDSIPRELASPREGDVVRGTLRVAGWARPSAEDAGEVLVSINPGDRRLAAPRVPRPGEAAATPGGFELRLPAPERLEAASVLVEVRDARGRAARLGPVRILWGPPR